MQEMLTLNVLIKPVHAIHADSGRMDPFIVEWARDLLELIDSLVQMTMAA